MRLGHRHAACKNAGTGEIWGVRRTPGEERQRQQQPDRASPRKLHSAAPELYAGTALFPKAAQPCPAVKGGGGRIKPNSARPRNPLRLTRALVLVAVAFRAIHSI